ncbi:enoyl-CoA hydratase [Rhodococcus sp. ABRD24]|nr:enoyl-CoA hydratase [Rhodococcus sp. ABRD24]
MLDSGVWCFGMVVGPRCRESGVRVNLNSPRGQGSMPVFAVAPARCGIGFAL